MYFFSILIIKLKYQDTLILETESEILRQYTKNWLLSFSISALVFVSLILAFLLFLKDDESPVLPEEQPKQNIQQETEPFVDYDDNVGAVTFTEDQVTELARNIFSLDGYLNNIKLEFEDDGNINIGAKIKDKEKLIETYPQLEKYSLVLTAVENKDIALTGELTDNEGMAQFEITKVSVAGMPIDKDILTPFIEQDEFAMLFDVEYNSVEIEDGMLVFKNGVPEILQY